MLRSGPGLGSHRQRLSLPPGRRWVETGLGRFLIPGSTAAVAVGAIIRATFREAGGWRGCAAPAGRRCQSASTRKRRHSGRSGAYPAVLEDAPRVFETYVGGFRGLSFGAWWDGTVVVYESFGPAWADREQVIISPSKAQWLRFWRTMDRLEIW